MPQLQLQIDGTRDPEVYDDFGKAEKAIRLRVKQGKIKDTADIRIVPVTKAVAAPVPDLPSNVIALPVSHKVVREKYIRAPHHNTVMVVWGLMCMALGVALGHYLF